MNTKELRIGNLVLVNNEINEVESIGYDGINGYCSGDGASGGYEIYTIEYINEV